MGPGWGLECVRKYCLCARYFSLCCIKFLHIGRHDASPHWEMKNDYHTEAPTDSGHTKNHSNIGRNTYSDRLEDKGLHEKHLSQRR